MLSSAYSSTSSIPNTASPNNSVSNSSFPQNYTKITASAQKYMETQEQSGDENSTHELTGEGSKRVKIYELTLNSSWDDKGTGFVSIEYISEKEAFCIVVRSEVDNLILMENRVLRHDVYQRQQDTLIVWTEIDGRDLALSFLDSQGCTEIWDNISDVQTKLAENDYTPQPNEGAFQYVDISTITLPPIDLKHIAEINSSVSQYMSSPQGREKLLELILQQNFIGLLLEQFEMAEDLEMNDEISQIFNIFRHIITLNDNDLFMLILKQDVCYKVCAVFEHDPEYPIPRGKYRSYLQHERFRKVGDFKDKTLEEKIHQTFRAQYLKDVVLARIIEDPQFNVIHSIIMLNQVSILNTISSDDTFLSQICSELKDAQTSNERKKLVLLFMQDFCCTARNIQMANRQKFYTSIVSKGILQELQPFIIDMKDISTRMVASDIIAHVIDFDSNLLRSFIMSQRKHATKTLSEVLIQCLLTDDDGGMKYHYADILRMLLDWSSQQQRTVDQDNVDFIALFYNEQLSLLLEPLKSLIPVEREINKMKRLVLDLSKSQIDTLQHIMDLLGFLVKIHHGRVKSYILRESILQYALKLLHSKLGTIKIAPIRLVRIILSAQDEFYNRYIVKHDILRPIMEIMQKNGSTYNLLNSVILDLLEYISTLKSPTILKYLTANFSTILQEIDYIGVGKKLLELSIEKASIAEQKDHLLESAMDKAWGNADADEDAYFSNDTEEEKTSFTSFLEDQPPIPKSKDLEDDDDFLSMKTRKSAPQSRPSLGKVQKRTPLNITIRSKSLGNPLVDYPSDDDEIDMVGETSNSVEPSPGKSPKLRNITLGTKRIAIDEADPRHWDRETLMDVGPALSTKSTRDNTSAIIADKKIETHKKSKEDKEEDQGKKKMRREHE